MKFFRRPFQTRRRYYRSSFKHGEVIPGRAEAIPVLEQYVQASGPDCIPGLLVALRKDKRAWVRKEAVDWLSRIVGESLNGRQGPLDGPTEVHQILRSLTGPSFAVHPGAVTPYIDKVLSALDAALRSDEAYVANAVMWGIRLYLGGHMRGVSDELVELLEEFLARGASYFSDAMGAAQTLGAIGPGAASAAQRFIRIYRSCQVAAAHPELRSGLGDGYSLGPFRDAGVEGYAKFFMNGDMRDMLERIFPEEDLK